VEVKISENIILIGTAHISKESAQEVKDAIEKYKPAVVAVELCQRRYKALTEKDKWENTPVTALLKGNQAYFVLAQTFLASIQRRLGKEYGAEPGSEMIVAINEAKAHNLDIALVDRDIAVTLKRAWRKMSLREKMRLAWAFLKTLFGYDEEELEKLDLKEMMDQDVISEMLEEFTELVPSVAEVLIHERDAFIAKRILDEQNKGRILAVVGAGHLEGIKKHLEKQRVDVDLAALESVPKKRISLTKVVAVAVPMIFAAVVFWLLFSRGDAAWSKIGDIFLIWFLVHGILSAAGAAIARGHPLSCLTAFVAAPFTSLEPFFAPGWFAGLVEAKFRMPVVKDFQDLSKIETMKDFFRNRVVRLLMVVALANLGSIIGTVIALPWILSLGLG